MHTQKIRNVLQGYSYSCIIYTQTHNKNITQHSILQGITIIINKTYEANTEKGQGKENKSNKQAYHLFILE